MKINEDECFEAVLSVEETRNMIDLDLPQELSDALDAAQARVFGGETKQAFVIIMIEAGGGK